MCQPHWSTLCKKSKALRKVLAVNITTIISQTYHALSSLKTFFFTYCFPLF